MFMLNILEIYCQLPWTSNIGKSAKFPISFDMSLRSTDEIHVSLPDEICTAHQIEWDNKYSGMRNKFQLNI